MILVFEGFDPGDPGVPASQGPPFWKPSEQILTPNDENTSITHSSSMFQQLLAQRHLKTILYVSHNIIYMYIYIYMCLYFCISIRYLEPRSFGQRCLVSLAQIIQIPEAALSWPRQTSTPLGPRRLFEGRFYGCFFKLGGGCPFCGLHQGP